MPAARPHQRAIARRWEAIEWEWAEVLDVDDEVAVHLRQINRGHTSGIEVRMDYARVWTLREGIVTRQGAYDD